MATKQKGRGASAGKSGPQLVENRERKMRVGVRTAEQFLRRVIHELGVGRDSVSLCFVTDRQMARLNETYRKKKGTTDVLSFPAEQRGKPITAKWIAWKVGCGGDWDLPDDALGIRWQRSCAGAWSADLFLSHTHLPRAWPHDNRPCS